MDSSTRLNIVKRSSPIERMLEEDLEHTEKTKTFGEDLGRRDDRHQSVQGWCSGPAGLYHEPVETIPDLHWQREE